MVAFTGWTDRLSWSGEVPLDFPDLNPVALCRVRFDQGTEYFDEVDDSHRWARYNGAAVDGYMAGPWGSQYRLNGTAPATDQGRFQLDHFPGLWPDGSGRLLMGLWVDNRAVMSFSPLMSSRGGSQPMAYLSTDAAGRPRQSVYGPTGSAVADFYETPPWSLPLTGWEWFGMLVDFDAGTTRFAAVNYQTGQKHLGPVRSFSGPARTSSNANLDVFSLQTAGYWSTGGFDEVLVAHPGPDFDLAEFAERQRLGTWARGASPDSVMALSVTDAGVTASVAHTLSTGAEAVSWGAPPEPVTTDAVPYWSTDGGSTWSTGDLPADLDGLLRWEVPLASGEQFSGLTLLPPRPVIDDLPDVTLGQHDSTTVTFSGSWSGAVTWTVAAVGLVASVTGSTLSLGTGWAAGDIPVTVSVRDSWGRTATTTFVVTVEPQDWSPPPPRQYPRAPIVVWDGDGPDVAIIDALSARVVHELNGEHTLEFSLPRTHRAASAIQSERAVDLAGERYRIRRVTDGRAGGTPVTTVYCEAGFYDLAYAGQISAREFQQVPAGAVIEEALEGTGWTVAAVTVSTRRTYSVEETNPLALLRTVQQQHGGDLLFDNANRTVSLVVRSGRDEGVSFFYGRGLTESKRVVDTTSLVTRIYARNADGVTIASVNDGRPYVEDFSWTSEVREATYDFAAGTSPFTMLSMSQATLTNRSRPSFSYEFTVADISHRSGLEVDRFGVGDMVTVVDDELGIREAQRIVQVEHDVVRPWASKITLSGKLRELGGRSGSEAGDLTTGSLHGSFDLVPFNLLRNGRFDNGLAHWASSGAELVDGRGTGDSAVRLEGPGRRWIEQTVQADNRDSFSLSLNVSPVSGGQVPPLRAVVTVEYEDGTLDSIPVELV